MTDQEIIDKINELKLELNTRYFDYDKFNDYRIANGRVAAIKLLRAKRKMSLKNAKNEIVYMENIQQYLDAE